MLSIAGLGKVLAVAGVTGVAGMAVYSGTSDCETCPISATMNAVTSVFAGGSSCDVSTGPVTAGAETPCTACPLTGSKAQLMADAAPEVEDAAEAVTVEDAAEEVEATVENAVDDQATPITREIPEKAVE